MKQAIIFILFIIVASNSFGQDSAGVSSASIDYVQKSKHQKTAAWIMLGGGLALAVTGVAVSASNWESSAGDVLLVIGGASMIGSIPFFIASGKNKKKARSMSAGLKMETAPSIQRASVINRSYPAVAVNLRL